MQGAQQSEATPGRKSAKCASSLVVAARKPSFFLFLFFLFLLFFSFFLFSFSFSSSSLFFWLLFQFLFLLLLCFLSLLFSLTPTTTTQHITTNSTTAAATTLQRNTKVLVVRQGPCSISRTTAAIKAPTHIVAGQEPTSKVHCKLNNIKGWVASMRLALQVSKHIVAYHISCSELLTYACST